MTADTPVTSRDDTQNTSGSAMPAGPVSVTVCTPHLVRIRFGGDGKGLSYLPAHDRPPSDTALGKGQTQTVKAGQLSLQIGGDPFSLTVSDASGAPLLRQAATGGFDVQTVTGATGATRRLRVRLGPVGEQHFYGLGHGGMQLDRYGTTRHLWTSHYGHGPGSDIPIPLLLSSKGYGLFFDNTSEAYLHVGGSDRGNLLDYSVEDSQLDLYIMHGGDLRGLLNEAADLLGRPVLPPRWALGYMQSSRHFEDTEEVRRLPHTLREKRIPCDSVIFLSTYGTALSWNVGVGHLDFQPQLWAQPKQMLDEMRAQGFNVIMHEYPVLHEDSPLYPKARAKGFLLDDGYARVTPAARQPTNFALGQRFIDFSNPAARTWWWQQHRQLCDLGVAGWWLDGGEGPAERTQLQAGTGIQLHNTYDVFRHQAFAEGEAADRPEGRPYLLCRSGGAGMQRYGASCWTGDNNNTFATLEQQLVLGLDMGMSGVPYWGTDIGGFFHPIPQSAELFARWFEFGAFCPVFRSHGWVWREHTPWAHGPEVESICRRYSELRYRLLPYTYTLAWQAYAQGLPLMRPLVLNYPNDVRVWDLPSEYLWGDDLLVAPVTREGATQWPVYLPAGGWYNFWTQERYDGPLALTVDAPLDRLPLFVRAGAILPLAPVMQYSSERPLDEVTLLIYPEGQSQFTLYEDDGCSPAYQHGVHAQTEVSCTAAPGAVRIRVAAPVGNTAVIPATRSYLLQVKTGLPQTVHVDGTADLPQVDAASGAPGWWHDGAHFLYVRLPQGAAAVTIS